MQGGGGLQPTLEEVRVLFVTPPSHKFTPKNNSRREGKEERP